MVIEPAALLTTYTYDIQGNMKCVDQWGASGAGTCSSSRARSFNYDSLSRLVTTKNPETGTICYGQWVSGTCQGGYDPNGNLRYKTDARGFSTSFTYDALNRMVTQQASGINNLYQYDLANSGSFTSANLIGSWSGHLTIETQTFITHSMLWAESSIRKAVLHSTAPVVQIRLPPNMIWPVI